MTMLIQQAFPAQIPKAMKRRRGVYADALRTYLKVVAHLPDDRGLDRLILRIGSRRALDLLALHATNGRMRYEDLREHLLQRDSAFESLSALAGGPVEPALVVRIARIVALQDHRESDKPDALHTMLWVYRQAGREPFRPDHARLFQNLAFELEEFELAAALAAEVKISRLDELIMRADLANPHGRSPFAGESEWTESFSRLFTRDGVEPPSLLPVEAIEPFDRLSCISEVVITDGPLVTVIVTSWRPGPGLETAVRSLLNQSWRNLEILVVDDASPESYAMVLEQVAAMDSRIKVIRLEQNGGTYEARNAALRVARGELITGQDSDDWSHPRRIEKQAKAILRKRHRISSTSHAFRCDPRLIFNAPGTQARRENASSLMFRRADVLERVGFYDSTRKGGDTEYMLRIRKAFGDRSHSTLDHNLAMIRQTRGSLSTAEFRPGWRHPSRSAYRRSYEFWHSTCSGALRLEPGERRAEWFPLPARFRVKADPGAELDIVFADDLRGVNDQLHLRALLDEINIALHSGLKVGVMHLRSLRDMSFERIDTFWAPFSRLLSEGKVREVLTTDEMSPKVLVVRRPDITLFLAPAGVAVRPRRILVAACEPPLGVSGEVWYDPTACDRNIRDAFARRPEWRADAGSTDTVRGMLPKFALLGPAYPVAVDVNAWLSPGRDFARRRPVIGRIAAADAINLPNEREVLLAAYPPTGKSPTRFLGGEAELRRILGDRPMPASWTVLPEASVDPDVFLSRCDFFVYFDCEPGGETPARLFSQAMASGCVVVSSERHADSFEGAVVSARPDEVYQIVAAMSESYEEFTNQVAIGKRYLTRLDTPGFLKTMGLSASRTAVPVGATLVQSDAQLVPYTPEVIRDHLKIAGIATGSVRLDATILRTGSENARDLLARTASDGRVSFDDITRHVEACRAGGRRADAVRVLSGLDPAVTIRLARIMILQRVRPDDCLNGLTLCETVVAFHGPEAVPRKWSKVFIDVALQLNFQTIASTLRNLLSLTKSERREIDIDLKHPEWTHDECGWLYAFNAIFRDRELAQLRLRGSATEYPMYDRIEFDVAPEEFVRSSARVTVIITAWCPTVALRSSVRSILAQTWRNLEVLIIDDCSPPEYSAVLQECADMDTRVRVLRQEVNQGTYMARNRGLSVATGEFVTFQDADDYSHPTRIERQIYPLLEDQGLMATRSASVRVDNRLLLANPGSPAMQGNASSLMIRRAQVIERIGYFDGVRKGADTEFALRIAAAFGQTVVELDARMPLSLVRLEPNSLSRAEFKPGWRHPARAAYREAYEFWHQRVRSGEASPFLANGSQVRQFPAPQRFRIDQSGPRSEYEVVFIGDWRQFGGPQKSMIEEIRSLHKAGLRLAICQMEAFRFMTKERKQLCSAVRTLIHDGVVDQITTSDLIRVRLAVLRYPPILQYLQADPIAWKLSSAVVVANQAPSEHDGSDVRYCVADCIRNARALFGMDPVWVPQGPLVREALEALVPCDLLDEKDMPGILDASEWRLESRHPISETPIIGRYSRDNPLKFPDTAEELLQAYPSCSQVDVRIMGGSRTCTALLGGTNLPRNWELIPYGQMDVKQFLSEIDYFVYFDNNQIVEAFGRSILEAIASGRIVILPEKFRSVFGEAALYCGPAGVEELVCNLHANPGMRAAVRDRAARELQLRFSHESYCHRITGLLAGLT